MEGGIAVHLAPLALFHIGSFPVTNTFLTTVIVSALIVLFAYVAGRSLTLKPSRFQAVLELLVMYPYDFVRDTLQNDAVAKKIYPVIMTVFLLILAQNWFGLLPITEGIGARSLPSAPHEVVSYLYSGATDLNFTLALAVIVFLAIEFFGFTTLGVPAYLGKFFKNPFRSPISFVVGIIELISEFVRLVAFSFRLFGNIFAGKVLILVIMFFVPLVAPVPFLAFETFVGFIQAAIFALLTLFFTKIAIELHEEETEAHAEVLQTSEGESHHSPA